MDDPDPAGNIILQLLLLLVLILVNAFFAMSEIAVISLNDNKIQKMAEEGHKKAKQILHHSDRRYIGRLLDLRLCFADLCG